jgi:hypothetical protein
MKRGIRERISECRKHLMESKNSEDSKDEKQEIIMFAKKLLEKEGFVVKRLREETDCEDEGGE